MGKRILIVYTYIQSVFSLFKFLWSTFIAERLCISASKTVFLYIDTIPGPEVIKLFPCSTQLSMKFFLLINVKMPTIVVILTFMSRKNSNLCLSEPEKS